MHAYDHDPAAESFGMEAAEALGLDPATVFKTLLAEVDGSPVVAIVPVTGQLNLKALAVARGGKRARMMEVAAAERLTGYVAGGISPLGQRKALPTVIDVSAGALPTIYVSGGQRGLDIGVAPQDLLQLTDAAYAPIATPMATTTKNASTRTQTTAAAQLLVMWFIHLRVGLHFVADSTRAPHRRQCEPATSVFSLPLTRRTPHSNPMTAAGGERFTPGLSARPGSVWDGVVIGVTAVRYGVAFSHERVAMWDEVA